MAPPEADAGVMRITFLYSGQGDCIVIECPNGGNIVVDCGSTDYSGRTSAAQLRADFAAVIGADESIQALVVTHPDSDHYNRLASVIGDRPVGRVIHSLAIDRYGMDFGAWLREHAAEEIAFVRRTYEHEPSDLFECGGPTFQIMAVNAPRSTSWTPA